MTGVLIEGGDWDTDMHREKSVRTRGEDDCLRAKAGGLRRSHPAHILVSDIQPPGCETITSCGLSYSVCGHIHPLTHTHSLSYSHIKTLTYSHSHSVTLTHTTVTFTLSHTLPEPRGLG